MKKTRKLVALLIALVMTFAVVTTLLTACKEKDDDQGFDGGTFNIKVWVSESDGVKELTEQQIARFNEENEKYTFNATVEGVSESTSATNMITSVEDGADIFCFAQDQTARLVEAKALSQPGKAASREIEQNNVASSAKATQVAGKYRAYPLTADNGYYMYYDNSVISESDIGDLAKLVAACEAAGKNFSFELGTSAWYNAAFFFATGCHSDWTTDSEGKINGVDDNFNSAAGLVAMKGMRILAKSDCHVNSSTVADFSAATPSAVVISGAWDYEAAKNILGDHLGCAELPSFTVDGKTYHLGSFSGCKLMGVKPTNDANKAAGLSLLARYLTGEKCQMERLEELGWGPSNLAVQASDLMESQPHLSALAAQAAYAVPQSGNIHGSWWDIAKLLGVSAKEDDTEAKWQAALTAYKAALDALFTMTDEEKRAWSVIGVGDDWGTDHKMIEEPANTWISEEAFTFAAGDSFKCRMGASWDVQAGDGNGENFVVETAGTYKVKVVVTVDGDGNATGGTIELIAQ